MARKKEKPIKIITLDTETYDGLIGDLKRIAVYDGKNVTYGFKFTDIEHVLTGYAYKDFDVHVYIHNLEFDARKIPEIFNDSRINWKGSLIINGKLATIKCNDYTIHDSFKLLPMSLSKLSQGFNVTHGKMNLLDEVLSEYNGQYEIYRKDGSLDKNASLVNFLDKCDVNDPIYLKYLGFDVISLYEVLQVLMEISGLEERDFVKRISTASLSRHLFKNGYKGKQFRGDFSALTDYDMLCKYKWYYDLETEDFIRDSYCGGRTEVFKPRLEHKGYHYDVNSLYPYVMSMCGDYPIGKPYTTKKPNLAKHKFEEWRQYKQGLGFINAKVFIPMQPIPPLPVKMGKLTFPCGTVVGTWTYEELEYAITECGVEILEYYGCVHFKETYPVFKRFVECFYKLKEEGNRTKNEPLRTLAKLILNVGYGYTGMRRDDKCALDSVENADKYETISFRNDEFGYIEVPSLIKSEYIQVQVASYVTSRARLVLLKALRDVVKRGGNVYYCDTDSVVCDIPFDESIVDSDTLGMWDLESEPTKGLFIRPKVYTEVYENKKDLIKFKGVSRETQSELDYSFYEHLYSDLLDGTKDSIIVEKNRTTMRSIMYMQKEHLSFDYFEERDKKMNYKTIEKRVMYYDENRTEPHFFVDEQSFYNFSYNKKSPSVIFHM